MKLRVIVPLMLGLFLPLLPAEAGNPTGRAAVLPPITHGRAAHMKPVMEGRPGILAPAKPGLLSPVSGKATLKPLTLDRAAKLKGVTAGRAAAMKPATFEPAAEAKPATVGGAGLLPVKDGVAVGMDGENVKGLKELAVGDTRVASLDPAAVPGMVRGKDEMLTNSILTGRDLPVFAWNDGYLLPYEARSLVRNGYFNESLYRTACSDSGYQAMYSRLSRTFNRRGWGRTSLRVGRGSGYWAMNRLDNSGPQWHYRSSYLRRGCLPGRFVGDFYFPLGYYLRPIRHGSLRYNKTWWPILVPWDCVEAVPEDFKRTLRKSHFPMVMGDMAFKDGNYVQAALAFRDALDRHENATPAGSFAFADALIGLRNYQYADTSLRAGLSMAPTWADKLDRNGVYGKKGDLAKHLGEVEKFTKEYPRVASGWFLLGYLQMTSGDVGLREKALDAFGKLLEIHPDDELGRRYSDLLKGERREIHLEIGEETIGEPTVAKKDAE